MGAATTTFVPTAAIVIEIVSPDDETWNKLEFYAAHEVDELLIVNPRERSVVWLALRDGVYAQVESSGLLGISSETLRHQIDWPALA